MLKSRLLAASALVTAIALMSPGAAFAQTAPDADPSTQVANPNADPAEEAAQESGEVIVTGSRISRPNLESTAPITSITAADLTNTSNVVVGDRLNELPALRSTFSQANSIRFIGTAGLNVLDLRGLGTARTLTVVNGRRHVTTSPGDSSVDVNTIPTDLIERVDIVTGGNSAIYGSDAVAGVVNFVLKRDFEGFRMRAQGSVSDEGDRGAYFVSATAGKNFAEGRGNVAVSLEYAQMNPLYFADREDQYGAFRGRDQFNVVENTIGESAAGNGIPDNAFLRNVKNISISTGGAFVASCPTAPATGESAAAFAARRALVCTGLRGPAAPGVIGPEIGRAFVFDSNGNLIQNNGTADLRTVGSGNNLNGLGSTLREVGQLNPGYKRYAANLLASFEVSPAFRPFVEAKYVRVDSVQEGQATFFTNTFSINNPFLTTQARNTLVAALAPGATTFSAQRFNIDFAGRGEDHRRETYRIVAGVDGRFNDDWKYEVAFNYGHLKTYYETRGNVLLAEYARSINAVRNAAGQIVCAVNADALTTNDDPRCVPVNLFGNGAVSKAALDYFGYTSSRREKAEQLNAIAYVSGDLSQLFELPGGPVAFSLGGEYRKETAYSEFDPTTQAGLTFLNAIPTFDPPNLVVKEAFGEIRVPLLADRPFFHKLSLEAAGRVSDYNIGQTGTVYSYNVGATWAPVRSLAIRGSYAKSVRAPTQSDLFSPPSQTFLNGLVDPCGQQNINNNPNRVKNCAAAGVPTTQTFNGVTEPFTNRPASGILGLNGSNPNLEEERGTSYTIGAIFRPEFVPGLAITVDYYNITIKNVIQSLGAQTIINQCYDSPSGIDNQYCAAITRNPNGTFAGQNSVLTAAGAQVDFPRTGTSFLSGPFNFAKLKTTGIDADISYRRNLGDVTLDLRGIVSYLIRRDNFTDINRPEYINQAKLELGDPAWEGTLSANLDFGSWDLGYRFRYIGKQTLGTYEEQHSLQGRPPENADRFARRYYPVITYSDFRVGIDAGSKGSQFYLGVDNVFDRLPPYGLTGTGAGDGIFDNVGRRFYAGFEARF